MLKLKGLFTNFTNNVDFFNNLVKNGAAIEKEIEDIVATVESLKNELEKLKATVTNNTSTTSETTHN